MAVISDFVKTGEYVPEFVKAGLNISGTHYSWGTFPVMVARKS
jgi:hypothetical protein